MTSLSINDVLAAISKSNPDKPIIFYDMEADDRYVMMSSADEFEAYIFKLNGGREINDIGEYIAENTVITDADGQIEKLNVDCCGVGPFYPSPEAISFLDKIGKLRR